MKEFIKENLGRVIIGLIVASVVCVLLAFVTGDECCLNAGCVACSSAILLPFIVEPEKKI